MENNFGLISVPYGKANSVILPLPYEGTVTYGKGAAIGPAAVISASQNVETYDLIKDINFEELKFATLEPLDVAGKAPDEAAGMIGEMVASIVADGKYPLLLGGEHSITPPAVASVGAKHDIGVVQLDAHADLRNEYGGTKLSHACVMARVRENFKAVQLGIRSCSLEEKKRIDSEKLEVLTPDQLFEGDNLKNALDTLPQKVYLSVDLDVFDPSIMPSTGTPEPGGLNWEEVNLIIDEVAKVKTIVGADVVELSPINRMHAPDFLAAKLAFNILAVLGRKE